MTNLYMPIRHANYDWTYSVVVRSIEKFPVDYALPSMTRVYGNDRFFSYLHTIPPVLLKSADKNHFVEPGEQKFFRTLSALVKCTFLKESDTYIISLFVLASYVYNLFDSFPILWIYGPLTSYGNRLRTLFKKIAFCPIELHDTIYNKTALDLIEFYSPTLIFEENHRIPKHGLLISQPNDKHSGLIATKVERKLLGAVRKIEMRPLYCQKVVFSSTPPPKHVAPYSIPFPFFNTGDNLSDQKLNYAELRGEILQYFLSNYTILQKEIELQRSTKPESDIRFPFIALANTLRKTECISEKEFEALNRGIETIRNKSSNVPEFNSEEQLITAISHCVKEHIAVKPQELFILEDLVTSVKAILPDCGFTTRTISQFLNRRNLISYSERPRVEDQSGKKLQKTAIRIDIEQLQRFIAQ